MQKLSLKVFLSFLVLMFGAKVSYSFPIECKNVDPSPLFSTFVSPSAAKSWLPDKIILRKSMIDYFGSKKNRSSTPNNWIFFVSKMQIKAKYLPSKRRLKVQFTAGAAYKMHAPVYYRSCTNKKVVKSTATNVGTAASNFNDWPDDKICRYATISTGYLRWKIDKNFKEYVSEAKRRGLDCGVVKKQAVPQAEPSTPDALEAGFLTQKAFDRRNIQMVLSDLGLYKLKIDGFYGRGTQRALTAYNDDYFRGLDLSQEANVNALFKDILTPRVVEAEEPTPALDTLLNQIDDIVGGELEPSQVDALADSNENANSDNLNNWSDTKICEYATDEGYWHTDKEFKTHIRIAKGRGLDCGVRTIVCTKHPKACSNDELCEKAWLPSLYPEYWREAKRRGVKCGIQCFNEPSQCIGHDLCFYAIDLDYDDVPFWSKAFPEHTREAKKQGVDCGVRNN